MLLIIKKSVTRYVHFLRFMICKNHVFSKMNVPIKVPLGNVKQDVKGLSMGSICFLKDISIQINKSLSLK